METIMGNPLFNMLGGNNSSGGPMDMMQQFQQFRQQMQGKDPKAELDKLLQSGKINQDQLNHAQQMARQMQGMFKGMLK